MQSLPNQHASSTPTPVSVVVPMFNERECVASLMASLAGVEAQLGDRYTFEFVLVDDGSRDETVALLNATIVGRSNYRLVEHGVNRGIGAAIGTGIAAASHEVVVSMDCDGSYDPLLMGELLPLLAEGVSLVTASPYHRAGGVENVPLWRLRLSRLASQLYGLACRHKLSCYTSCFRVYRRSAVVDLQLENPGFVGVAELLCQVLQQGGVVVEHPAMLRSRVAGHSKMRVVRASLGHLRLIGKVVAARLGSVENAATDAAENAEQTLHQLRPAETSANHTTEETPAVQLA
ncbi:glycosyltransferase family 2 protein [Lacipirellula sp.]|uniref:glycosyltransferase family 2 protein n=1 Tax=Lacipirellula sp. TaxID=2691419 RepID=UPI003D0DBDF9